MKDRDRTLFVLFPGAIALLVILFAVLFGWLLLHFERSYLAEAEEHLAREARLAAKVVQPLLEEGKLEKAREFCDSRSDELRLSLINAAGKVEADSAEKAENLASHLERKEVKEALAGEAAGALRYSTTLNRWMIYHAVHLKAAGGGYVLRAAVSTARVGEMVSAARLRMLLALGIGAGFIFILMLYLYFRVRVPLTELQLAAGAIAGGELSTEIAIPERGVIRELALEIDRMAGQLKQQLRCVTAERNEKEAILNGMEEAVLLFAGNGDLVRANQAARRLFLLTEGGEVQYRPLRRR